MDSDKDYRFFYYCFEFIRHVPVPRFHVPRIRTVVGSCKDADVEQYDPFEPRVRIGFRRLPRLRQKTSSPVISFPAPIFLDNRIDFN